MNHKIIKKLLLFACLTLSVPAVFAQSKKEATSKWTESRNGVTATMELISHTAPGTQKDKAIIAFKISGEPSKVSAVQIVGTDKVALGLAGKDIQQKLTLLPGHYTLKISHVTLGVKTFDLELKKSEETTVELIVK